MFLGLLAAAIIAGIAYLAYRVTTSFLKKYRKKKDSQLVMASVGALIGSATKKQKNRMTLAELDALEEHEDDVVLAEYDEDEDELVQQDFVDPEKWMDDNVETALDQNDGVLVIEG
ncbi:MAG: hypothetical protein LUG91_03685 [Ruminococcus sp.]|nr:hypothetical protein [Ruminococcus sp.]